MRRNATAKELLQRAGGTGEVWDEEDMDLAGNPELDSAEILDLARRIMRELPRHPERTRDVWEERWKAALTNPNFNLSDMQRLTESPGFPYPRDPGGYAILLVLGTVGFQMSQWSGEVPRKLAECILVRGATFLKEHSKSVPNRLGDAYQAAGHAGMVLLFDLDAAARIDAYKRRGEAKDVMIPDPTLVLLARSMLTKAEEKRLTELNMMRPNGRRR